MQTDKSDIYGADLQPEPRTEKTSKAVVQFQPTDALVPCLERGPAPTACETELSKFTHMSGVVTLILKYLNFSEIFKEGSSARNL